MKEEQPIIIKKIIKKGGHGGHHGGAWKVAYADFVTAMMCLFLLLWLVNVDPSSKSAIAEFFKQPTNDGPMDGNIFIFGGAKRPGNPGKFEGGASFLQFQKLRLTGQNKEEIRKMVEKDFKFQFETEADEDLLKSVQFSLVDKGILIELKEHNNKPLFKTGSSVLTKEANEIVDKMARALKSKGSPLIISGYTDGKQFTFGRYDNWNLSTDRAHAIRKRLQFAGLDEKRIAKITGYGSTQLKIPEAPYSSLNRRITLLMIQEDKLEELKPKYLNKNDQFTHLKEEKEKESALKTGESQPKIKALDHNDHKAGHKLDGHTDHDEEQAKHGDKHEIKHTTPASSRTAGKRNRPPTLEELRRRNKRKNYYAKFGLPTAGNDHGGDHGEEAAEAPTEAEGHGGHGGGH